MARKSAAALATPPPIFTAKRPPPPDGLPPGAAALWVSICAGVDANYFAGADLTHLCHFFDVYGPLALGKRAWMLGRVEKVKCCAIIVCNRWL